MMNSKLKDNIWKFAIHSITKKRAFMTFLAIYLLTFPNATAKTIGLMTLIGQTAGFILEIPSGYISDKIGHKKTLVIARVLMTISTSCFAFANDRWWFIIGSIFLSISMAFMSGTESAFMHNTLTSLKMDNMYSKIMGKVRSVGFAVPIIFILTLSFVAESNFRTALMIALVIDFIGLLSVISMKNPTSPTQSTESEEVGVNNFYSTLKQFIKIGWLPHAVIVAIGFGIVFGSTAGFKNTYQEFLGLSISTIGILWSLSRIFISMLLYINGWIYKTFSFKKFIVIRLLIYSASFIGIGLANNLWTVASLFIIANITMWGFMSSESHYFLDFIKKNKNKATLLSVKSFIDKIVSALTGIIMGYMIINSSYMQSYLIIGITLFLTTILAMIIFNKRSNIFTS